MGFQSILPSQWDFENIKLFSQLEIEAVKLNAENLLNRQIEPQVLHRRHNGKTDKLKNLLENPKIIQYRTITNDNNIIYEENILYKGYPALFCTLWNTKDKNILQLVYYVEEGNTIRQHFRKIDEDQFLREIEDKQKNIITTSQSSNKDNIVINSSIIDFIVDYNVEETNEEIEKIQNINDINVNKPSKWNIFKWKAAKKGMFCFSWAGIGVLATGISLFLSFLFLPLIGFFLGGTAVTIASVLFSLIAGVISSITVGLVVKDWNKYNHKWKKSLFPNWKSKAEIANDMKLQAEKQKIEAKMQKHYSQILKPMLEKSSQDEKITMISNKYNEFLERNKNISFENFWGWLSNKIEQENKNLETNQVTFNQQENNQWNNINLAQANLDRSRINSNPFKKILDRNASVSLTTEPEPQSAVISI